MDPGILFKKHGLSKILLKLEKHKKMKPIRVINLSKLPYAITTKAWDYIKGREIKFWPYNHIFSFHLSELFAVHISFPMHLNPTILSVIFLLIPFIITVPQQYLPSNKYITTGITLIYFRPLWYSYNSLYFIGCVLYVHCSIQWVYTIVE